MSQPSQRTPTLLTIPQELRDMIYAFSFTGVEANLTSPHAYERNTGLLETCRQTREEAEKLYYKLSIFSIEDRGRGHFNKLLNRIPRQYIPLIRELRYWRGRRTEVERRYQESSYRRVDSSDVAGAWSLDLVLQANEYQAGVKSLAK